MSDEFDEVIKVIVDLKEAELGFKNLVKAYSDSVRGMEEVSIGMARKATAINARMLTEEERRIREYHASLQKETQDHIDALEKREKEHKAHNKKLDAIDDARIKEHKANLVKEQKDELEARDIRTKDAQSAAKKLDAIDDARIKEHKANLRKMASDEAAYNKDMIHLAKDRIKQEAELNASRRSTLALGSKGLRSAAGVLGATGNYQLGAAAYGAANAVDLASLAGMSVAATAATTGVLVLGAAVGGLLYAGKDLNEALANMSTLIGNVGETSGETAVQISSVANMADRVSVAFNVGIVDVVKGFKDALSSGVEAKDLERFGMEAGKMSAALDVSFKDATNILTSFKDSYGQTISELSRTNDVLFNIVNVGKVNIDQLINSMGKLLPVGKSAGLGIEDLGAAVALLTRHGMTSQQSITSVIQVIQGLVNPSEKARKALTEAGIATGDMAFEGKNLVQVVKEITQATGGKGGLLGALFPEERAFRGVAIMTQATQELGHMKEAMYEVGTAADAADKAQNTLWANLGKSIKGVTNEVSGLGADLANLINVAVYGATEIQKHKEIVKNTGMRDAIDNPDKYGETTSFMFGQSPNDRSVTRKDTGDAAGFTVGELAVYKIKVAAEKAEEAVKKLNDSLYKPQFQQGPGGIDKFESKTKASLEAREFEARATQDQKQELLDLKLALDDIDAEKESIRQNDVVFFAEQNKELIELRNNYVSFYKAQVEAHNDAQAEITRARIVEISTQLMHIEYEQGKELTMHKHNEEDKLLATKEHMRKLKELVMSQIPEFARAAATKEIEIVANTQEKIRRIRENYNNKYAILEKQRLDIVQKYADKEKEIREEVNGLRTDLKQDTNNTDVGNIEDPGKQARRLQQIIDETLHSVEKFALAGDKGNFSKEANNLKNLYDQFKNAKIASGDNSRRYQEGGGASYEAMFGETMRKNINILEANHIEQSKVKEQRDLNELHRRHRALSAEEATKIRDEETKVKLATEEVARLTSTYGDAQVGAIIEAKAAQIKSSGDDAKSIVTAIRELKAAIKEAAKPPESGTSTPNESNVKPSSPATPGVNNELPALDDSFDVDKTGKALSGRDSFFDHGAYAGRTPKATAFSLSNLSPVSALSPSAIASSRGGQINNTVVNVDANSNIDVPMLKDYVHSAIDRFHKDTLVKGTANRNDTTRNSLYPNTTSVKSRVS